MSYYTFPDKYNNRNASMINGLLGGNNVSLYNGSMVDLESELKGQTRSLSRCHKYEPTYLTSQTCTLTPPFQNVVHQPVKDFVPTQSVFKIFAEQLKR